MMHKRIDMTQLPRAIFRKDFDARKSPQFRWLRGSSFDVFGPDINAPVLLQNQNILGQIKKIELHILSLGKCQVSADNWFFMSHARSDSRWHLLYDAVSSQVPITRPCNFAINLPRRVDRAILSMKMQLKLNAFVMIKNDCALKTDNSLSLYIYVSYKTPERLQFRVSYIIDQGYYWSGGVGCCIAKTLACLLLNFYKVRVLSCRSITHAWYWLKND